MSERYPKTVVFVPFILAAVPHVFNEHNRGSIPLLGFWLIVSLSGCQIMNSSMQDTGVADLAESNAIANQLNQQGIHFVQNNQLGKAEFKFEEAIRVDKQFGPAHNNLGLVFYHQHDFFEAGRAFEAAHEHMPDSPEPLNNLGLLMETVARPDDAIDYYQQAHEMDPTCAEYLGNLLRARIRMQQIDEELLSQLHSLLLYERRIEWQDWAREQLALLNNPNLDRGPAPSSDPLSELTGNKASSSSSTNPSSSVIPEQLPNLEPLPLPSPSPSPYLPPPSMSPSPMAPPSGQPSMFPTSLPPSSRRQKSILESLE